MDQIVKNEYEPSPSGSKFHASSARFIVLVGGIGSSKSFSVIKELERSGLDYPGIHMGVYRKTMPALRDSTLQEFKEHIAPVGRYGEKAEKFIFSNESFINFRGLDDPTKAKSTEYGLLVMEEAEEFTLEDFRYLNQRVRQKGAWPLRIVLVLNPVDEEHWIYKEFVDNSEYYAKNGGLLVLKFSTRDNLKNLPPDYIAQSTIGMSAAEIARMIDGEWGTIVKGKPVYGTILNPDIHLRILPVKDSIYLLRGWDFGHNRPACSMRLVDPIGRMNCSFSMLGDREYLDVFAGRVLSTTKTLGYEGLKVFDYGDPRGHDKGQSSQSGTSTAFEILAECGIHATGERGSRDYVEPGIKQVRAEFSQLINGVPKLTINPTNTLLRNAYFNRYVRGDDGKPIKDGLYEHVVDADRYISHHHKQFDAVKIAMEKHTQRRALKSYSRVTGY